MPILFTTSTAEAEALTFAIGGDVTLVDSPPGLTRALQDHPDEVLVVFGPDVDMDSALDFASAQRVARPELGAILIRRRVDTTVLTDALRAGVREVVKLEDMQALAESSRRVREVAERMRHNRASVAHTTAAQVGKVVTVFSPKGGTGKTTLSTNLSAALTDGGRRKVCIFDLDLAFGDVAVAMQLFPAKTIADAVAMQDHVDETGLRSLVTTHRPGLDAILAPMEPSDASKVPASVVKELLEVARTMYDYVVVDTPPEFSDHVLTAFDHSDAVLMLSSLDIPSVKNLKLALETLDVLGYPKAVRRVVLNRADSKVGLTPQDVEETLRTPISAQLPSSRQVPVSTNRGTLIVLDSPSHPVSVAIQRIADELAESAARAARSAHEQSAPAHAARERRLFAFVRRGGAPA